MKKVLSFVLVLAMILGSVSMVFAAPATKIKTGVYDKTNTALPFADAETNYVTTILRDLGFIDGDQNGNINVAGELTRADAAALLVKAMGYADEAATATCTFADVAADKWYAGYIAVAKAYGFVDGVSATEFAPEAKITVAEVYSLILKVLGINDKNLTGESWTAKVKNEAGRHNLTKDIKASITANATRGDVFQVLFNALDQLKYEYVQQGYQWYTYKPLTYTLYQEMMDNYDAATAVSNEYIWKGVTGVVTAKTDFVNGFDASAFYGQTVDFVTKKLAEGQYKNIGIAKVSTEMLTGKFASKRGGDDATSFVTSAKTYTFGTTEGTTYGAVLANTVTQYVNGVQLVNPDAFEADEKVTYNIWVKFTDTTKTKIATISAISYWEANAVAVVTASQAALLAEMSDMTKINDTKALVDVKNGSTKYTFFTTKSAVSANKQVYLEGSCAVEGAATALDEIQEDDVLEIYLDPVANKIVKLVVVRNKIVGTVKTWADTQVNVGGTTYKLDTTLSSTSALTVDRNYTSEYAFYLDAAGKYVTYTFADKKVVSTVAKYGFVTLLTPNYHMEDKIVTRVGITVPGEAQTVYTLKSTTGDAVEVGAFVTFTLEDGKVAGLTEAGETSWAEKLTVKEGMVVGDNMFASDVKVYRYIGAEDDAAAKAKASNYKEYDFTALVGKTFAENKMDFVVDSAKNLIKFVILKDTGSVIGEEKIVTGVAFVSADGTQKDADGREVKLYTLLNNSGETFSVIKDGSLEMNVASLYAIKILEGAEDELIGDATVLHEICYVECGDITAVAIESGKLEAEFTGTDRGVIYVDSEYQVWLLDKAAKTPDKAFGVSTLADATDEDLFVNAGEGTVLKAYDLDGNNKVDLITVYIVPVEE